MFVICLFVLK